jgi:Icc-related predicted phosphoesterase
MRYVGHMQTTQGMWHAWILEPREGNRVVWSLKNCDHKPILSAIKAELKRLGIDRSEITAEWPDTPRPPGVN